MPRGRALGITMFLPEPRSVQRQPSKKLDKHDFEFVRWTCS